jgi:death-on-curing protein
LTEYLDLADYLLIAEEVLGVPAETIAGWPGIGLAESALSAPAMGFGEIEFYPDVIDKAAVLCVRLARNHPLPDGNKPALLVLGIDVPRIARVPVDREFAAMASSFVAFDPIASRRVPHPRES